MSNIRDSLYVDGFHTANIPGCTLLDVSEPVSPSFRVVKRNVVGRDGFWHDAKEGVDGVIRDLVFETETEQAFQTLLSHLYPGLYAPISLDYQYPKFSYGLVKQFHVEEMGFAASDFVRVVTFTVEFQPYLLGESSIFQVANGTKIVNPGAATDDFRLYLHGTTGVNGERVRFQHRRMGRDMTVRVLQELVVDNARKNLYNHLGAMVNTNRKSGFYFVLLPGETTISWTGTGITRAELIVNWRYWA